MCRDVCASIIEWYKDTGEGGGGCSIVIHHSISTDYKHTREFASDGKNKKETHHEQHSAVGAAPHHFLKGAHRRGSYDGVQEPATVDNLPHQRALVPLLL